MLQPVATDEASSIEEATQVCLDLFCLHTAWPIWHVYIPTTDGQELSPSSLWHLSDAKRFETFRQVTQATQFASGVGLPGRAYGSRSPAWIADVPQDANSPRARLAQDIGVKAGFALPVLVGEEVMAHVGTQLGRMVERQRSEEVLREREKQ